MNPWGWLDRQADWIRDWFPPLNQMRLGVLMTDLGIVLAVVWPLVARSEPPLIYEMSALALIFGGVGVVVTAKLAENTESTAEDAEQAAENTERCAHCGANMTPNKES